MTLTVTFDIHFEFFYLDHNFCLNILTAHYDDVEEKDLRVKYMWEALKNFSNEDRSRFLRFITGL